jgi:hypothetical protein
LAPVPGLHGVGQAIGHGQDAPQFEVVAFQPDQPVGGDAAGIDQLIAEALLKGTGDQLRGDKDTEDGNRDGQ